MSRIGKIPVTIPSGVEVTIEGRDVTVKGPKGTLRHTVIEPISVERGDDGAILVKRRSFIFLANSSALQNNGSTRVSSAKGIRIPRF